MAQATVINVAAPAATFLSLNDALAEVDAAAASAEDGQISCSVCFCDYEPNEVVQCLNPRKNHALCKDCFINYVRSRGTGPFAGLTVAQAAMPMCVHANPNSGEDECLCSGEPGDYSKSFFHWREVTQKGWMSKSATTKLRDECRAKQLEFMDEQFVGDTLLHVVPLANRYLELRGEHETRLAKSVPSRRPHKDAYSSPRDCQDSYRRQSLLLNHIFNRSLPSIVRARANGETFEAARRGGPLQAAAGVAGEHPPAPTRLLPCLAEGCTTGRWQADIGDCLVCKASHCVKCGKSCPQSANAAPAVKQPPAAGNGNARKGKQRKGKNGTGPDDGKHKCNPDDVQSHSVILRNTKSCPRCAAAIMKASGCDQMFCTLCQTAFSYRTGKVETGVIHNPHFFALPADMQRQIREQQANGGGAALLGGAAGAGGCLEDTLTAEQFQRFHDMLDRLCASGKIDTKQKAALANACDFVGHCSASVRAHCLNTVEDDRAFLRQRDFELEGRRARLAMIRKEHLPFRIGQCRSFPPSLAEVRERAEELTNPRNLKQYRPGDRLRDAKARDTRYAKVEQCVGLCGDYAVAARLMALSAAEDASEGKQGALRALALLLRNWEKLLSEAPERGGGRVNPHPWVREREQAAPQGRREQYGFGIAIETPEQPPRAAVDGTAEGEEVEEQEQEGEEAEECDGEDGSGDDWEEDEDDVAHFLLAARRRGRLLDGDYRRMWMQPSNGGGRPGIAALDAIRLHGPRGGAAEQEQHAEDEEMEGGAGAAQGQERAAAHSSSRGVAAAVPPPRRPAGLRAMVAAAEAARRAEGRRRKRKRVAGSSAADLFD